PVVPLDHRGQRGPTPARGLVVSADGTVDSARSAHGASAVTPRARIGSGTVAHLRRRLQGAYEIDEWGLDPELVAASDPWVSLRWDTEVTVAGHVPVTGGAVLVFNRRLGISEPWVLARG